MGKLKKHLFQTIEFCFLNAVTGTSLQNLNEQLFAIKHQHFKYSEKEVMSIIFIIIRGLPKDSCSPTDCSYVKQLNTHASQWCYSLHFWVQLELKIILYKKIVFRLFFFKVHTRLKALK